MHCNYSYHIDNLILVNHLALQLQTKLQQVKSLTFYNLRIPSEDYSALRHMTNLTQLTVKTCPSFGDQEFRSLTNLTSLTSMSILYTSVNQSSTNIVSHIPSLTNFVFKARTLPEGSADKRSESKGKDASPVKRSQRVTH